MARPRRGHELAAETVIDAAAEVFAANGFSASTLDQVAERLGVTRQSVLGRFPSKRDLFRAVLDRDRHWADQMLIAAASIDDASPFASLIRFLGLGEEGRSRIRLQHVLQGEAIAGDADTRAFILERNRVIHDQIFQRAQRADALGILAPGWTVASSATAIMALINGLQTLILLDPDAPVKDAFDRAMAGFILKGEEE